MLRAVLVKHGLISEKDIAEVTAMFAEAQQEGHVIVAERGSVKVVTREEWEAEMQPELMVKGG